MTKIPKARSRPRTTTCVGHARYFGSCECLVRALHCRFRLFTTVSWFRFDRMDSVQWNPVLQEHADEKKENDLLSKKSNGNGVKSKHVKREDDADPTNKKSDENHGEVDADAIKKTKDDADPREKTKDGTGQTGDEADRRKNTKKHTETRTKTKHDEEQTEDDADPRKNIQGEANKRKKRKKRNSHAESRKNTSTDADPRKNTSEDTESRESTEGNANLRMGNLQVTRQQLADLLRSVKGTANDGPNFFVAPGGSLCCFEFVLFRISCLHALLIAPLPMCVHVSKTFQTNTRAYGLEMMVSEHCNLDSAGTHPVRRVICIPDQSWDSASSQVHAR